MSKSFPVLGRLMSAFGVLGFLLCVVLFVAVWIVGVRVVSVSANTADQLELQLGKLVRVAVDTQTGIDATRKVARELELRLREHAKDQLQVTAVNLKGAVATDRIDDLETKLMAGVQKVRLLADRADALMLFAQELLSTLQATEVVSQRNPEAFDELVRNLQVGHDEIVSLELQVLQLKTEVKNVRAGLKSSKDALEIKMLSDQVDSSLMNLSKYTHKIESGITGVIESVHQLHRKLRSVVLVVELVFTLLLIWQASAQWSLALQGRRITKKVL